MQIIAKCPKCGSIWLLDGDFTDRRVKCSDCGRLFKVPSTKELPEAAEMIKKAKGRLYVDESGNIYG